MNCILCECAVCQLYKDFFEFNTSKNKKKDTAAILSIPGRTYDVDVYHVNRYVCTVGACTDGAL